MLTDVSQFNALLVLLTVVLAFLVFLRAIYLRRQRNQLTDEVKMLRQKVVAANAELRELRHQHATSSEFQKDLYNAELTTRLQTPRLSMQHGKTEVSPPERYLYVRSLIEKGMTAREIASILTISNREAEQLVNLSKLTPAVSPPE